MSQINPSLYLKPYGSIGRSDGWYVERSTNDLVAFVDGTEVSRIESSGDTTTLADGYIFVGNASNVATAVAVSGDVAITRAGVTTVSDLTITSEARGDLLRRGASGWERFAAKTDGSVVAGDGTDVSLRTISAVLAAGGLPILSKASITLSATGAGATGAIVGNAASSLGNASGVEILASSSGKVRIPLMVAASYTYAGAPYTDGAVLDVYLGGTKLLSLAALPGQVANRQDFAPPTVGGTALDAAAQSLYVKCGIAWTQPGSAAGTIGITAYYLDFSV